MVRTFFRTLRLLRLLKLVMVLEDVFHYFLTDWLNSTVGILKILIGMILFTHFVACFWYLVGVSTASNPHTSWTLYFDGLDPPADLWHRYVTSFHWSMCQYTPAPNNIHPVNAAERSYACITLLFGILLFSFILGKTTSLLTHMSAAAFDKSRNERTMRQYMSANTISLDVISRINVFLSRRQTRVQMLSYSQVQHFLQLPESLATELRHQSYCPVLHVHALIFCLDSSECADHCTFVSKLCSKAIIEESLKWGDELLHPSSTATDTVFVKGGRLEYSQNSADEADCPKRPVTVGIGQWACEMALWCCWTYCGQLSAKEPCIALMMDASAFHSLVKVDTILFTEFRAYAEAFTSLLVEHLEDLELSSKVDDLWGQAAIATRLVDQVFQFEPPAPRRSSRRSSKGSALDPGGFWSKVDSWRRWK